MRSRVFNKTVQEPEEFRGGYRFITFEQEDQLVFEKPRRRDLLVKNFVGLLSGKAIIEILYAILRECEMDRFMDWIIRQVR